MADLVPIQVKILRGPDGKHAYPPFNSISPEIRGHLDWSVFFDTHGIGWHYDKISGLGEADEGNPDPTCWFGCTCVPAEFAKEAVRLFPSRVEIVPEKEWEAFYDERAHAHEETEILDVEALRGLQARLALEADPSAPTVTPSEEIVDLRRKMLDPEEANRGIRKNPNRRWASFKSKAGLSIHPDHAKSGGE